MSSNKLHGLFRRNLTRMRREQGWSYRRLADETSLSAPYVYQIEAGLRTPRLDTMDRIAKAFGSSLKDMLT